MYSRPHLHHRLSKLFFWMIKVCADGTFFAFTGGSELVTWPELTPFLTLKRGIGNSAFFFFFFFFLRRLWWERTAQKGAPRLTAENLVVWRNFLLYRKISKGWLRAWWSSIRHPLSVAESSSQKKISIIAERRQFFQVFYRGIAMPSRQKLWMLNTRLEGVLPFNIFHKGTF